MCPQSRRFLTHLGRGLDGSPNSESVYHVGMIDFLVPYTKRKILEKAIKSTVHDAETTSVDPPDMYAHTRLIFVES